MQTPVLIVGAGPVGLTAAIDLAWRGIPSVIVETRYPGEPPPVKCNHVASRTMETFRRLGFAADVRAAGLPSDFPNDVVFLTTSTGMELGRVLIPSVDERANGPMDGYIDSFWPTAEPPHRINQIYLEPVIFAHASKQKLITILNRTRLESFAQDESGVTAQLLDLESGTQKTVRADWMLACDGGRSGVRKALGIKLEGQAEIARYLSTHVRAPKLLGLMDGRRRGWMNHAYNGRRTGNAVAIDGKEEWLVHAHLKPHEKDFSAIDRDRAIRDVLGVDDDFEYEVLSKEDWIARRLVAERFREDRVFLCGDAAHIWIPIAGYGMNAGIADVMNLTFSLAGHISGFFDAAILDTYEIERHPITDQLSRFVGGLGGKVVKQRNAYGPEIEEIGPEGDRLRAERGEELIALNAPQYCCAGLNFSYSYDTSPVIFHDGEAPPPYSLGTYEPSTVPGARAPHFMLEDGRSLYDAFGPWFTLLRFDPTADVSALTDAASAAGMPVHVLDVTEADAGKLYRHRMVLCRSDQHIVWRGDELPADCREMIEVLAGRRMSARKTQAAAA